MDRTTFKLELRPRWVTGLVENVLCRDDCAGTTDKHPYVEPARADPANASYRPDLDFQGGACDIDAAGTAMTCAFQQVLIAPAPEDPSTCRIVTNHYTQTFAKESERHWVSREGPDGPCGTKTETSIDQDTRSLAAFWRVTMIVRKRNTASEADRSRCAPDDGLETLTSTDEKRPLRCAAIVASSLEF